MTQPITVDPIKVCEEILHEEKRYNLEAGILPSETKVVDHLLSRRLELPEAYRELHTKLVRRPRALETFFAILLSTAAFWRPQQIVEARGSRSRLREVNGKIASLAGELAALVAQRSELHNTSGFISDTHYHVAKLIEEASNGNYLFKSYVRAPLKELRGQFSLKYWPSIEDCLHELGRDASEAAPEASDPITAAATTGLRASLTDWFSALRAAITDNDTQNGGPIPSDFALSDATFASLANCALDLAPEAMVDAAYVKGVRQRWRKGAA